LAAEDPVETEVGPHGTSGPALRPLAYRGFRGNSLGLREEAGGSRSPAARRRGRAVVQKDVPIYQNGSARSTAPSMPRSGRRSRATSSSRSTGKASSSTGETLFQIDPRQFQAAYDQSRASLSQYEADARHAKTTAARYRPLAAQKAISQQELDDAETKERTATANVENAKARWREAKLDLGWTKIVSPIDGIAGVAKSQVGDLVNRLSVMTTVSKVDPIKVNFNPSEQEYLAWVAKNGPPERTIAASTKLEEGRLQLLLSDGSVFPHRGRGILVGREVDTKTGTIQIAGVFPNPGNVLRPGQYAKVRVAMDVKKGAILVPQRAVSELQGSYQVALVGPDNKVTIKVVKTGPVEGNLWVIEEGLKPGDKIIVEGLQRVKSGMTVNPTQASAPEEGGSKGEAPKAEAPKETKG
jgi:membrane fusion protein (multidrug efflux system)